MDDVPIRATRRAVLGASAITIASAAAEAADANAVRPDNESSSSELQFVVSRADLAAHRVVAFGTRVILGEPLRRGEFVASAASTHPGWAEADPFQAFCVKSTVDPRVVWIRVFTGPASLDWSGAVGDGVADDAPFLNAMLSHPSTNHFQVEDGRNHFLGTTLRIERAITLTGAGLRNSRFTVRTSIDAIDVSLSSEDDHGLHLASFGIANVMPPGEPAAGSGIRLRKVYMAKLSEIQITDCWNGIHASHSGLTTVEAINVNGSRNAGLLFDGGRNFDVRVLGFAVSGCTYAIRMDDMCDEMIFADGVCSSSSYALYTDAGAYAVNQCPEFCRFARVSFDNCEIGLELSKCRDIVFDSCFISCRPGDGAILGVRDRTDNIQFISTTFFNNGGSAAIIGAYAIDTDFLACKFISNGVAKADSHDSLVFSAGCGSFSVAHCRFRQGWDVASRPRYQVRIEAGGNAPYSLVANHFAPAGRGTVIDDRRDPARSFLGNIGL